MENNYDELQDFFLWGMIETHQHHSCALLKAAYDSSIKSVGNSWSHSWILLKLPPIWFTNYTNIATDVWVKLFPLNTQVSVPTSHTPGVKGSLHLKT